MDIIKPLADQTVSKMNTDVTFTCELNKPNTKVVWYKGRTSISADDTKYTIGNDGCVYHLTVKGVKPDDESDYTMNFKDKKSTAELFVDGMLCTFIDIP